MTAPPSCHTEEELREDSEDRGWVAKALTSKGSDLAIAFLCTKALFFVRVPLTLGLTPVVARLLQRRAVEAAATGSKSTTAAAAQELEKRL
ncbi:hypothetical protein WJX81_006956 [Elliptochloris bilobata]|uniref:DUF1279 domain-containing protein n=1 Tax=Elliptochloris bilobata TaxID=381761 RepID=A0AAW1QXJ8_9CHLO